MRSIVALAAVLTVSASLAAGQQPSAPTVGTTNPQMAQDGPPPPQGPGGKGRAFARGESGPRFGGPENGPGGRGMEGGPREMGRGPMGGGAMRVGMELPHGAFWKNPALVARVGLTPDQVKKLEDLSVEGRLTAVRMRAAMEEDRIRLEPVISAPGFDAGKAEGLLDKLADERAGLEKAEAKSLVSMRAVLTPEQWTKLKEGRGMGPGGPGGPEGMRGGMKGRAGGPGMPPPSDDQR